MILITKIMLGFIVLIIRKTIILSKEQKIDNPIHKYLVFGCYVLFGNAAVRSIVNFDKMTIGDHIVNNLPYIFWTFAGVLFPIFIIGVLIIKTAISTLKMRKEVKKLLSLTDEEKKFLNGKIIVFEIKRFDQEEPIPCKILIGITGKKLHLENLTSDAGRISFEIETTFLILYQITMMMEMRSWILKKEVELYKNGIEETHDLLKQRFELSEKSTLFFNTYGFRAT